MKPKPAAVPPPRQEDDPYRLLTEQLPAVSYIVELQPEPHTVYISPQVRPLLGFTPEEWLADPGFWIRQLDPEDRDRVVEEVRQRNLSGDPFFLEYRIRAKDGRTVWVRNSATYLRDQAGALASVHGVMLDITERKQAEQRLKRLNDCLLGFGPDTAANINAVVALCGDVLGAACALYNRLDSGLLCALGHWQAPPDFKAQDRPEGHICFDVIRQAADRPLVIRRLQDSAYAQTDPNVKAYGLQTYIGVAVKSRHRALGSLCVVYPRDLQPAPELLDFLHLAAHAVALEEERRESGEHLKQSEQRYRRLHDLFRNMADVMPDMLWAKDLEKKYIFANRAMCERLLCARDTNEPIGKTDLFFARREREAHPGNPQWHTFGEICADSDDLALTTGQPHQFDEYGNVRGRFLRLEVIKAPLRNEKGEIIGTAGAARDITARKQAENDLRNSHELLELFIRNSPIFAFIDEVTPEASRALCVSDNYTQMTGVPAADMPGKTMEELFPPDLAAAITRENRELVAERRGVARDEVINGRTYTTIKFPIVQGDRTLLAGYSIDITERQQAEERLRLSEMRLAEAQGIAGLGSYVLDIPSGSWECSQVMREILGLPPGAAAYTVADWEAVLHPDDRARMTAYFQNEVLAQGRPFDQEYRIVRRSDRAARWVHGLGRLEFDARRRPVKMVGTIQDITERQQAEAALREREANFFGLFNTVKQAIYIQEMDSGRFITVNQGAVDMYGYALEEFIGKTPEFLSAPGKNDFAAVARILEQASQGIPQKFEFWGRRKDGAVFPKDVWTVKGQYFGHDVLISVANDITERRMAEMEKGMLEAELHQAQKMESVGRLAGGMAHDFNNILQAILGNVELAMASAAPDSSIHQDLREVQGASRRAADLIRQLLAFARKQTVMPRTIDLNQTIENMLKMLRRLIGDDVRLTWTPARELWPVRMDPVQVDQILANLCVNARDAMGGTGEVLIETRNASVDELNAARHEGFAPGDYVLMTVSDTGCGMGKETQDRIFEPFFTTKELGKGTGLGLSTVYGIVRQNQGHIAVYSEPRQGTTFRIYLPRHREGAAAAEPAPAPAPVRGGTETLLLVEDDPVILKLTSRIVAQRGYNVLAAGTPAEALRLAEEHSGRIHLLLTDIVMPGMNGRELSERLLHLRPDLHCLFMSGYTANVIARQGMLSSDVHFIQKPFSMAELETQIRNILDG